MAKVSMSVQDALNKKKILEKRIKVLQEEIRNAGSFIIYATKDADTIGGLSREDAKASMKASFQKITSLMSNLKALKIAVNANNATTTVVIGGKTYTIADAIAEKRNIISELTFIKAITEQLNANVQRVASINADVNSPEKLQKHVSSTLSELSEEMKTDEMVEKLKQSYIDRNQVFLVDPNNINDYICTEMDRIEKFDEQVDTALTVSNINTVIEVDYI